MSKNNFDYLCIFCKSNTQLFIFTVQFVFDIDGNQSLHIMRSLVDLSVASHVDLIMQQREKFIIFLPVIIVQLMVTYLDQFACHALFN